MSKKARWYSNDFSKEQELQVLELARKHPKLSLLELGQHWVEKHSPGRKTPHATTVMHVLHCHGHHHLPRPTVEPESVKTPKDRIPTRYEDHHRWIVERTFAWMGRFRHLSKDYEATISSSEGWMLVSMISHMVRRLEPGTG